MRLFVFGLVFGSASAFKSPHGIVRSQQLRPKLAAAALATAPPLGREDIHAGACMQPLFAARARAPPLSASASSSADEWDASFRRRRLVIFVFTVIAYAAYYLVRNSIYYTAPAMVAAPDLAVDLTSIGVISSVFPLTYGCSKFVSGVVGDVLSPRWMLACGLALTACVNLAFGCAGSLPWFVGLWAVNGILQGWGGPACAKLITAWFGTGERGTYWGLWNISHNFGAFLAPLIAGTAALRLGWRYGVWAPGAIALVISAAVVAIVRDSPESLGRTDAESAWNAREAAAAGGEGGARGGDDSSGEDDEEEASTATAGADAGTDAGAAAGAAAGADDDEGWLAAMEREAAAEMESAALDDAAVAAAVAAMGDEAPVGDAAASGGGGGASSLGMLERLTKNVLSKPAIWVLALSFLCVYLMRQGLTTWMVFYMIEAKGVGDFAQAAARVSGLELGGLVGSLLAGKLSDRLIAQAPPTAGHVGRRLLVVRGYLIGFALCLLGLYLLPNLWWAQWAAVFMVGFFLYGPQMLIGLCGAELVGRDSVGASEGFLGWVAYLGAASAGYPLSLLVKRCGWPVFFQTLGVTSGLAFLLLSLIGNAQSFTQREAAGTA